MEGQGNPPNTRAAFSLAAVPGAADTVPGGSVDRLSRLPDHLVVYILLKLRIKQAGKTCALSRHWRRMWAQLPVLEFEGVNSSVIVRALTAYQAHREDDIHSFTVFSKQMDAQQILAWLSLTPPLLSGRLYFDNRHTVSPEALQRFLDDDEVEAAVRGDALELPCFNKATEILMDLGFLGLALPPVGVFDALRMMWLEHFWFPGQLSISDTMFPSLQELIICRVRGLVALTLNSKFLLDIHLSVLPEFQELNILAPRLEELDVTDCFYDVLSEPVVSIAAERLKVLRWEVPCVPDPVCLRKMPPLLVLQAPPISTHWSEDICAEFLNCFPEADQLKLQISLRRWMDKSPLLMKDITIPRVKVLWLYLETNGHVFEGRVMQLLTNCSGISELKLSFQSRDEVQDLCLPDCICRNEPKNWEAKVVEIMDLKRVKIVNFHGAPREVYFLEQLVLRAPRLELLRVTSMVEDHSLDGIGWLRPKDCEFEIVPGY